jgi:hypothetical protein
VRGGTESDLVPQDEAASHFGNTLDYPIGSRTLEFSKKSDRPLTKRLQNSKALSILNNVGTEKLRLQVNERP